MAGGSLAALARRVRGHLAGRGEWWWAPLLYAIAVAWIYRGLWHQHGHPTGMGWDMLESAGPDLEFQAHELRDGMLSAWNPYDRGGYPVVADPSFDRYYPAGWPFLGLGALTGAEWWLIQLKMLTHQVIAASMLHLYLRSRGLSRSSAVVGGVTLVASVPLLIHKASLVFVPLIWVPLAWLALDRMTKAPSWRTGLGVAGVAALVVTASSPPGLFYAALLIVPYAIWRVVQDGWNQRTALAAYARRLAVPAALAVIVTGMIAAVVIVPFQELVPLTVRAGQKGTGFAVSGPLPPGPTWAGMLAPSHGRVDAYIGLVGLALAIAGVALAWRRDGRIAILWVLTAALALMLTFGALWPVLPWMVDHVPGFDRLRAPPRYKLITAWALAPLVAVGWSTLTRELDRRARRMAIAIAATVVLAALIVIATRDPLTRPPDGRSATATLVFAGIAAAIVIGAAWLPRRWLIGLCVAAPVAIACDAPFFAFPPGAPVPAERRPVHDGEPAMLASLGDVSRSWRVFDEFVLGQRVGVRRRVREFRGYPAGDPLSQSRYEDIVKRARAAPRILEAYNIRWILSGPHPRAGTGASLVKQPGLDGHYALRERPRWEALHPVPLSVWYGAIQVVPTAKVLDAVLAAESPQGTRRLAILEPEDAARLGSARAAFEAAAASPPEARAGELVEYDNDRIAIRIDAPAAGVVVLNEVVYPGWEVEVDGVAATPLRANYLLRAVAVPAGSHTIVWTFRPTHHRVLVAAYLLGLVAILAAWPGWRRLVRRLGRLRRPRPGTDPSR